MERHASWFAEEHQVSTSYNDDLHGSEYLEREKQKSFFYERNNTPQRVFVLIKEEMKTRSVVCDPVEAQLVP